MRDWPERLLVLFAIAAGLLWVRAGRWFRLVPSAVSLSLGVLVVGVAVYWIVPPQDRRRKALYWLSLGILALLTYLGSAYFGPSTTQH